MSIDTSRVGITLAEEAVNLCDLLCKDESVDDLVPYIEDMEAIAHRACADANTILEKFRSVRVGLLEVDCFAYSL